MQRIIVIAFMIAGLAAVATANPVMPLIGQLEYSQQEASLVMAPDGSGAWLSQAWSYGGTQTNACIRIQIVDDGGLPIGGYPAQEIWLQFETDPGTATGCFNHDYYPGGMFFPDFDCDDDGWTQWTLPLRGGGWSTGPATIYISGEQAYMVDYIPAPPVWLRVNSADINGDLVVDLVDIVLFVQDYGGIYHYRSDLCWDGQLNLSDITLFTRAIGATCP